MRKMTAAALMLAALTLGACAETWPLGPIKDTRVSPPGPHPRPDPVEAR